MKTAFLAVTALLAVPAYADWTTLVEDDSGTAYLDPASIRATADLRRVWHLFDRKKPIENRALSIAALVEIDCKEGRVHLLQVNGYQGHMATGGVIAVQSEATPWQYIVPGSSDDAIEKNVCAPGR